MDSLAQAGRDPGTNTDSGTHRDDALARPTDGDVLPHPGRDAVAGPDQHLSAGPGLGTSVHPDHDPFALGVLLGVLIGEGSFGGDGKQPQVTLRMHVRHRRLFEWLLDRWPLGRLYGPYAHGGRTYYQLMFRGNALKERLMPLLDALPWAEIDEHSFERYRAMKRRYGLDAAGTAGSA
jgi:hypothetical protein